MASFLQEIMTVNGDATSSTEEFKEWLSENKQKSTYHGFLHWCFCVDWYFSRELTPATFVDIGTATPEVLEALMNGLRSGGVPVNEWVGALLSTADGTSPTAARAKGVAVATLLVDKGLLDSRFIQRSKKVVDFECLRRMRLFEPLYTGPPPSWW